MPYGDLAQKLHVWGFSAGQELDFAVQDAKILT